MTHRRFPRFAPRAPLATIALAVLAFSVAACGGDDGGGDAGGGGGGDETVRIGVVLPYTGPFGLYGKPMEGSLRARFAQENNSVDGRPVELLFEDDATDAKAAVTKVRKLVEQDKVQAVVCCASGAATLAVGPILAEQRIPQLGPIPNPAGLEKYDTAALAAPTAGTDAEKLGRYAATELGHKTAAIIATEFSYGKEVAGAFEKGFTAAGGQIEKRVFAPLGTTDFGSYLAQVGNPDVTFAGFAGADAIGFVKQYRKFNVKPPLLGHGPLVTELVLNAIGESAVGVGAGFYYSSQLENAENKKFIQTVQSVNKKIIPSHFTAGAWASGSVLIDAVRRAGADAGDGAKLAEAIRATRIEAPWGELRFDEETGYAIAPTYFYEVTGDAGKLRHKVIGEMQPADE